jgi:FAD:protein FMN transferase
MVERAYPTRRDFVALAAGAFVVAALPWGYRQRSLLVRRTAPAMGTFAELAVVHSEPRYAYRAMDAAIAELQRIERLMTRFSPDSDIGRANSRAATGPVEVAEETALVVRAALEWAQATDGGFDPSLARLVDLWDVKHRHTPPMPDDVSRLAGRGLYRSVDVSTHRGGPVIAFSDRDVGLDLGGIAGGYGVDRAADVLRAWGIRQGFVNLGGDIYAIGFAEDGEPWKVGVRSPQEAARLERTVPLSDGAIATSADSEQYFDYQGRRYGHILDPATGEPRRGATQTVTVTASRCIDADAGTTACFGHTRAAAERLLARAAPAASIAHLG